MTVLALSPARRRKSYAARAWQYAAWAQSVSEPERRAELLRISGMWLSLSEPAATDLRGAYEWGGEAPADPAVFVTRAELGSLRAQLRRDRI